MQVKRGQTSVVLRVKLFDSSVSTGAGKTGLSSASSGLIIGTIADNESSATAYTQAGSTIESISTLGTYAAPTATKVRFKEVDATNHPGVYEIQLADARFAVSSAKSLLISISGVTNLAQMDLEVPLVDLDPYDAVRAGLTALPNAAAEASGGLYTRGTGAGQINQDGNGRIDANVKTWIGGTIPAVNVTGVPLIDVKYLLGTIWSTPTVAGIPNVNVKTWNDLTTVELPLVPTTAGRKLDVSAGGEAGVDWANVGSPTTTLNLSGTTVKTATDVAAKTDNLPSDPADESLIIAATDAVMARLGAPAGASIAADIATRSTFDPSTTVIEGSTTWRQAARLWNAALFGKASGLETTTAIYRDVADSKDRIIATVDGDGNRSAITLDVS